MKTKLLTLSLLAIALCGWGCVRNQSPTPQNEQKSAQDGHLPSLNITSPGLHATTSQADAHIVGQTNRDAVWVAGSGHAAENGKFDIGVSLKEGVNRIPVSVSNGIATTTIEVVIERQAAVGASQNAAQTDGDTDKATEKKTITPSKPTAVKAPEAKTTPVPLKVDFSGSELTLIASNEPMGATLSWGRAGEPFQSYVIVKSTTDPALYFPKQFWVKSFSDIDVRSWRDTSAEAHKTTYYRVCKIKPDQSVTCGNVAKIVKP